MTRVAVLGTYDGTAADLFNVDLMQYMAAYGCPPTSVVFKTGGAPRADVPLNTVCGVDGGRSVLQVTNFNDADAMAAMRKLDADLFVYAGGRDLLRAGVLEASRLGCIGSHYGPLPEIRGMGTVEWSVINDRPITIAIQRMSTGVDTGDVVLQAPVSLRPDDTFITIRDRCYYWTKIMLAVAARAMLDGTVAPAPQRLEQGEQYYRLHADLLTLATRKLADRLRRYGHHPWARASRRR